MEPGPSSSASSSSGRPLRRLAPAPSSTLQPWQPERPPKRHRRKLVSLACTPCRKAKAKCSAERPKCFRCATRQLDCVYEASESEASSQLMRRQLSEVQTRNRWHEELWDIFKNESLEDAQAVLQRIRNGADVETVVRHVRDGDLLRQLALTPETRYRYVFPYIKSMPPSLQGNPKIPYLRSMIHLGTVGSETPVASQPWPDDIPRSGQDDTWKMYQIPYHAVELVDPRISSVKASPWTSVTSSDQLVRELLQLYFIFEHPFLQFLPKDPFLDDMVAGRHRFCSSILVNAMLARACLSSTTISDRYKFWDPQSLTYGFLAEFRRLLELEADRPSITTVQALAVVSLCYSSSGLDVIGTHCTVKAVRMGQALNIFQPLDNIESRIRRKVYTVTAWAIYGFQAHTAFYFFRYPWLEQPPEEPLPSYSEASEYFGEIWIRYPLAQVPVPTHHGQVIRTLIELRAIMGDIALNLYAPSRFNNKITIDEAKAYIERLQAVYDGLPPALKPKQIILPSHLKVHMQYHNICMALCEPFAGVSQDEIETPTNGTSTSSFQEMVSHHKACFETLIRLYYLRHGFESLDPMIIQNLFLVGQQALSNLAKANETDRPFLLSTILLCIRGLWDQGRSCFLPRAVLKIVTSMMDPQDRPLVQEYAIDEGESAMTDEKIAEHMRSELPVNIFSVAEKPSERIGDVIRGLEGVSVSGESDTDGEPVDSIRRPE